MSRPLLGAVVVFAGLVLFAWLLPSIMMAAGDVSPVLAAIVAVVFLFGFYFVIWLRSRSRR